MAAFTLAHLSDLHLAPLPEPQWRELAGKRVLGYINWKRKRSAIHQRQILDALIADLKQQNADHIAVTGDFTNISLPAEFAAAQTWLRALGTPDALTAIPGNHDAYVDAQRDGLAAACADYMRGDGAKAPAFPFLRKRGQIALIALSSAVPTAPFMATGTLGAEQCAALDAMLQQTAGLFRVVLVHHPLQHDRDEWHKRLTDEDALHDVLRRRGAELILHGHLHRQMRTPIDGPAGSIPAIGVPSASSVFDDAHEGAAYNLYRIARVRDAWQCEMITRGLTTKGALGIGELQKVRLSVAS
jgi:3',5'-cyclic AMP phosphodiesterase CpdA